LGSKFWAIGGLGVRGPESKIEEQRFVEGVMENRRSKNGSIPSKNKKKEEAI